MKLQFKVDNARDTRSVGSGSVFCRADLTMQVVQGNGGLLDLITVKECGICPSRKGGYALLSPSRTYEQGGETKWVNLVGWPQFAYDAAVNALLNAAVDAGWHDAAPAASAPQRGITKSQLQDAGLVDPTDPFADD